MKSTLSTVNPLLEAQTKRRRPSHAILARKHSSPITADVAARRAVRVSKLRNVKRLHRERSDLNVKRLHAAAFDSAPAVVDLRREVELSEAIGRGQFSVVRTGRVRPRRSAVVTRKVVVKTTEREYAPLLKGEIDVLKRFHHPNLCGLIAVARTDEGEARDNCASVDASERDGGDSGNGASAGAWTMHLVLEFCGQRNLTDVVDMEGPLSEEAAAATVLCLVTALACLHQGGICHRDVKPDNCIFRGNPEKGHCELCLIDFGLAAAVVDTTAAATAPSSAEEDCSAVGTVDFLAPECVLGDAHATPAIDVWGAGVVLYFALSGRLPFGSRNAPFSSIMGRIVAGRFAPIEGASRGATDLITRMLELESQHRITCAEALAHPWIQAAAHRARLALVPSRLTSVSTHSLHSNAAGASERVRLARTLTKRLSSFYNCGILARRALYALSALSEFTVAPDSELAAQVEVFDCAARAAFRDINASCSGAISRAEIALALVGGDESQTVEVPDHIWQSSCGGGAVAASGVAGDGPSLAFNRFRAIWLCGSPLYRTEAAVAIAHSLLGLADVMDAAELLAVLLSIGTSGAERMKSVATHAVSAAAPLVPMERRTAIGEDPRAPESQLPSSIAAAVAGLDNIFSGRLANDAGSPAAARERRRDAAAQQVEHEDVATIFVPPPTPPARAPSAATASVAAAASALDASSDGVVVFLPFCSPLRSSEREKEAGGRDYTDEADIDEAEDATEEFSPFGCGARVRVRFVGDEDAVVDALGTVRYEGSISGRDNPINAGGDSGVVGSYRHRGWIGVEVDEPVGVNSGVVDGMRYFNAAERCGIFVPSDACALLSPQRVPSRAPHSRPKERDPTGVALRTKGRIHRASVTAGVSIAADGLPPLVSCYLSKKSRPHKLTRTTHMSKRWFVCGDSYLRYYRNEAAFDAGSSIAAAHGAAIEGPLATIQLRNVESVAHVAPSVDFELRGADDASLSMRAPSSEIAALWAEGLRARIERLRRSLPSGEEAGSDVPMPAPAPPSANADTCAAGAGSGMPPPPSGDKDAPPLPSPPSPPTSSEVRPVDTLLATDRPPPGVLRVLARAGLQSSAPPRCID